MTLLRRATEQTQSDWVPVPEGLWRWVIGEKPELKLSEKYGNYQVRFPLMLTPAEQQRLKDEVGDPPEGSQQSWRTSYTVGLSLGYVDKAGQYKTTKLVDMLAASLGQGNTKPFRDWIAKGGGPSRPDDLDDQQAEMTAIADWLGWWEGLEVYGTIRHASGDRGTFANFSGPMAVGSLPGQKDDDYVAHGRGKLKAIIAESGATREEHAKTTRPSLLVTEQDDLVWQRYSELADQAIALGMDVDVPDLPIERASLVSLGVALKAKLEAKATEPVETQAPAF